jgi:succinate dehydrogenase / fumarate reductase flavoprotein subunit
MILQTLYQQCIKNDVEFFNELYVLDLLMSDDRVAGVVAYELSTGDLHVFHAKTVLFATGGYGRIFKVTSNAHALTGDGPAVVLRAGLPLEDMEFFQFHPTGIYGIGILLSEAARGEGGILRNAQGERFMEHHAPTIKDLAPRDVVSRSIYLEIREGRGCGPNKDYVLLDLTHLDPKTVREKLPDITEFAEIYLGVDPLTEGVPVQPTAHYAMGGIPTNASGQVVGDEVNTVVPGLYAAGECACVSVHGANRLGTNSLLDIIVFGRRGGIAMMEEAKRTTLAPLPDEPERRVARMLQDLLDKTRLESAGGLREELQRSMDHNAGVYRTEDGLREEEGLIAQMQERYDLAVGVHDKSRTYNTDLMEAVELGFMLDLAQTLVHAARARTESRGGHSREDHPARDDVNWLKHSLAWKTNGTVKLSSKPVTITRYQPQERKY